MSAEYLQHCQFIHLLKNNLIYKTLKMLFIIDNNNNQKTLIKWKINDSFVELKQEFFCF